MNSLKKTIFIVHPDAFINAYLAPVLILKMDYALLTVDQKVAALTRVKTNNNKIVKTKNSKKQIAHET